MQDYQHILYATDLGPDTDPVGERAAELARRYAARLSLIHVVEYIPLDLPMDVVLPERVDLSNALMEHARGRLREVARTLGVADGDIYLEFGSPKAEITRLAQEQSVDLIVVGSHGRHGLQLLLGSTANAVLHAAPCDALAVRIRD
jgi:universal stress protein A